MLREDIQEHIRRAMKDKDQVRLAALRYLWSEIKNADIDAKTSIDDAAIHAIIKREIKKRNETIEQMKTVGREELVFEEQDKVAVLSEFMMDELAREDIEALVDEVIGKGVSEFGEIMKLVMGMAQGRADGRLVSDVVRAKLGQA